MAILSDVVIHIYNQFSTCKYVHDQYVDDSIHIYELRHELHFTDEEKDQIKKKFYVLFNTHAEDLY